MKSPKVTVAVSTYNREKYINDCINSVLEQSYQDFELIIIDDGSTDNTRDVVQKYNDPRIKYYYQNNSGQNSARNAGINYASADYVALMDSDDVWHPEKLEKQVEILEENPDIGLVYCGTELIDKNGKSCGRKPLVTHSGHILDKLLMTNFLYNGSCPLFRKSCIERVGLFDCSITRMTDWEFYLRFAIHYKFFGIDEYLLKYRIHNETMSHNFKDYESCGIKILEKVFNDEDLDSKYLKYKNEAIARRYSYLGKRYFENGFFQESRKYFKNTIKQDFRMILKCNTLIYLVLSYLSGSVIDQIKHIYRFAHK